MPFFKIPEGEYLLSAPNIQAAPKRPLPEIAFAGRSNVGKSSLINSLLNRKSLALTSRTPGKTRMLNYYLIGRGLCYFVDLPGYGYARVSGNLKEQWGQFIEDYLRESSRLIIVVLILDIRHGLTPLDREMVSGLHTLNRPWMAVLTKLDKLNAREKQQAMKTLEGELISLGARAVIPYSSLNHTGRDPLWQHLTATIERK
ncbi:MAG TPA: ribosome biogenesis GTP-binding protein YihA/YsxC [bacterium]|jgi:GTP-binding protein